MKALKSALIAAGVGALLAVMGAAPAAADPIIFTWDPTLAATSLGGAAFTTDALNVSDYALIDGSDPNNVVENAYLVLTDTDTSAPGLVGNGQGGAGEYQLYVKVHAISQLNSSGQGSFTSFSYTLYGVAGGGCSFGVGSGGPTNSCSGAPGQVLATGGLAPGLNQVGFNGNLPFANANANITVPSSEDGFFVNPPAAELQFADLFQTGEFQSQGPVTYCDTTFTTCNSASSGGHYSSATPEVEIKAGGGTLNIVVPEPLTLSLFGAGLFGVAAMRRRSKKA